MFSKVTTTDRALAIQRLTALWALNECGLGGVLHALQSPFTGLLVGSIAMICIAMICAFAEHKWSTVMTSLLVVLIIKALVSPHSTPTAYIAVSFQAVTGALIFRYLPGLLFPSIFFVTLGLLESAFQRLLTMTILYGNTLWEAIDIWGKWVSEKWNVIIPVSSSKLIIGIYLGIHFFAGILIGIFIYKIIMAVRSNWGESKFQLILNDEDRIDFSKSGKRKNKWKRYVLFLVLMILILLAYTINSEQSDIGKGIISIVRSVAILSLWFLFLGPLFISWLKRFLNKKHQQLSEQVKHTMDIFPQLIWILQKSWKSSQQLHGLQRWKSFILHSILYILQYKSSHDPHPHRADSKPQDHNTPEVV
jgi:hypothetical protein